jgi:hypothetical protein
VLHSFVRRNLAVIEEYCLHGLREHVSDPPNHDSRIAALMRYLDELLAEAERLRADMADAVRRRADSPFWP